MLKKAHYENMFQKVDLSYFSIVQEFMTDIDEWNKVNNEMIDKSITFSDGFKLLISNKGLNVNNIDIYGRSILNFSSYFGYVGIVFMLLSNKADVTLSDIAGMSALTWGTNGGRPDVFIKYRAPLNSMDGLDRTALHHALRACNYGVAELLSNFRLYLYSADQLEGALIWASVNGHDRIVSSLLYVGISANEADENGVSALLHATANGHLECATLLINYGAEVNATDGDGRASLWHAISNGQIKIEKLLRDNNGRLGSAAIELTGLRFAVRHKQLGDIQEILKNMDSKADSWEKMEGFPSLVDSLRMRQWDIANLLVGAAGDDLNKIEARERTNLLVLALEEECPRTWCTPCRKKEWTRKGRIQKEKRHCWWPVVTEIMMEWWPS